MSVTQFIDISKLAAAVGQSNNGLVSELAAELADVVIDKAPVDTGRLVRSINVNSGNVGNRPKFMDVYRSNQVESNVSGLKSNRKKSIRQTVDRALNRLGRNDKATIWWINAGAPYGVHVNSGQAYRNTLKGKSQKQRGAAFANMKDKMKQRGQKEYQRKTGEGYNFFSITPAEQARAMRIAIKANQRRRIKV